MSTAKHTPGPWTLFNRRGVVAIEKDATPIVAWPGFDAAKVGGHRVNIANAKLMAAAPDLADALDAVIAERALGCAGSGCDSCIECQCRAALRKAGRLP